VGQDDNGIDYSGDSTVIDPQGSPIITLPNEEATTSITVSREQLDQWRQRFPAHLDGDDFRLE
jgi:predicted amidohydrolase